MFYKRKRSKYGNIKKEFNGRIYHSKGEAGYAQQLELRKRIGEIREIVPQFKLSMDVNDYHICSYYVDFKCVMRDGTEELHEVKGYETKEWKIKWKLTKALYGDRYKLVLIK